MYFFSVLFFPKVLILKAKFQYNFYETWKSVMFCNYNWIFRETFEWLINNRNFIVYLLRYFDPHSSLHAQEAHFTAPTHVNIANGIVPFYMSHTSINVWFSTPPKMFKNFKPNLYTTSFSFTYTYIYIYIYTSNSDLVHDYCM